MRCGKKGYAQEIRSNDLTTERFGAGWRDYMLSRPSANAMPMKSRTPTSANE